MSDQENRGVVLRYYDEVLNQGRLEVLDDIAATGHVEHNPLPGQSQGLEGLKQRVSMVRGAFNPHFSLEHVLSSDDKVAVLWTNRGTQNVEWFGVPPTGKSFAIQGVDIHLLRDGRMAEHWDVVDVFSLMVQIGAIPAPDGAPA